MSVKAGPMLPVRAILEQACQQLKPPVDAASCKLMLGKVALSLDEPIRFANIPSGAQLVLHTGALTSLLETLSELLPTCCGTLSKPWLTWLNLSANPGQFAWNPLQLLAHLVEGLGKTSLTWLKLSANPGEFHYRLQGMDSPCLPSSV